MTSKKKGSLLKRFLIFIVIILIAVALLYFLLPKIIIKTMKTESIQKVLPPKINKGLVLSERGVTRALKQLEIKPQQAIEEIDKIDQESIERIMERLSHHDTKDPDVVAEIIFEEFKFSHINKSNVKTFFRRNLTRRDIEMGMKMLEGNEMKTKLLLPAIKNSLKEIILTNTSKQEIAQ